VNGAGPGYAFDLKFSVTLLGTTLSVDSPDSSFYPSTIVACSQQWLQLQNSANATLEMLDFLSCTFDGSSRLSSSSAFQCVSFLNDPDSFMQQCYVSEEVIAASRAFSGDFPADYLIELPMLFVNGYRYCDEWEGSLLLSDLCDPELPSSTDIQLSSSTSWPAPQVVFNIDQNCSPLSRFPGDTGMECIAPTSTESGMITELVPVIGLLFLVLSSFAFAFILLFKRRIRHRSQPPNPNRTAFPNDAIIDIMQFLALLAARDDQMGREAHALNPADIGRQLHMLPIKVATAATDTVTCAVCLEPVESYYGLNCSHVFHKECLKAWLEKGKNDCPVCRQKVLGAPTPFSSTEPATITAPAAPASQAVAPTPAQPSVQQGSSDAIEMV